MNKLLTDCDVYVIHVKKGYESHEKRICELFGKMNLNFKFMVAGDTEYFNEELLNKYFIPDILNIYHKGKISCTLNHILAYEEFLNGKKKFALIFENDPFFLGNFADKLNLLYDEIQTLKNGFIISLENTTLTFPSFFQTNKKKRIYPASSGRMAGAYLINREGASLALNDLRTNKCSDIIDWWHNRLIERDILKMYWAHPPMVEQGSHNGMTSSTISTKKKSLIIKLRWLVHKFYKMYIRRLFKQRRIIEMK